MSWPSLMSSHDRSPPNTTVETVPSAIMHACTQGSHPPILWG